MQGIPSCAAEARAILFSAAICAAILTTPADAFVIADTRSEITLSQIGTSSVASEFFYPDVYIDYLYRLGAVHQDGYDTSVLFDSGLYAAFDFYAFAPGGIFPLAAINETEGYAGFQDGVLARFTNHEPEASRLDLSLKIAAGFSLWGDMEYGFANASARTTLIGESNERLFFKRSFSASGRIDAPGESAAEGYDSSEHFTFWLNPGEILQVKMLDVRNYLHIREAMVPEPGTWLLQLAGFGLVGAALRRRHLCLVEPV